MSTNYDQTPTTPLVLITIIVILLLFMILIDNDRQEEKADIMDVYDEPRKICIEGYVYFIYSSSISPKLNGMGRPVECP